MQHPAHLNDDEVAVEVQSDYILAIQETMRMTSP